MQEKPIKTKSYYPVSLDEAKRHLRIDDSWDRDDDYIRNLIYAATQKCEEYIGKDIAKTTNVWKIWDFMGGDFYIDEGNFISLDSVKADNDSTSLSVKETWVSYNRVYVALDNTADEDPLYVRYTTGFEPGGVPALMKQAVLVKIGDLYDIERQSYSDYKENHAYERLLDSYKLILY